MRRVPWRRVASAVFVVAAIAFFAVALVDTWGDANGAAVPSVLAFAVAGVLCAVVLVAACEAWIILLGTVRRRAHSPGFLIAQLGKYVPGGIWQAMGQVSFAREAGVSVSRATTAFASVAVTQVVAGAVLSSGLAIFWSSAPLLVRIALACGVGAVVILDRRWMVWVVRRIPRASEAHAEEVPAQPRILRAFGAALVSLLLLGCAYAVLLGSATHVDDVELVVLAQIAAWTAGFLVVPIPAGLGVRELVLVAILGSTYRSSLIVATSVYLRLVIMIVEGTFALAALAWRRVDRSLGTGTQVDGLDRP